MPLKSLEQWIRKLCIMRTQSHSSQSRVPYLSFDLQWNRWNQPWSVFSFQFTHLRLVKIRYISTLSVYYWMVTHANHSHLIFNPIHHYIFISLILLVSFLASRHKIWCGIKLLLGVKTVFSLLPTGKVTATQK